MEINYKHTWTLSRRAWYVRLYLWVWEANPDEITFCKLWWGYVLIWVGVPLRLFAGGLRLVRKLLRVIKPRRRVAPSDAPPAPEKPPRTYVRYERVRAGVQSAFQLANTSYAARNWRWGDDAEDSDLTTRYAAWHAYEKPGRYKASVEVARTAWRGPWYPLHFTVRVHEKDAVPQRVLGQVEYLGAGVVMACSTASSVAGKGLRTTKPVTIPVLKTVALPVLSVAWISKKWSGLLAWGLMIFAGVAWVVTAILAATELKLLAPKDYVPEVLSGGKVVGVGVVAGAAACVFLLGLFGLVLLLRPAGRNVGRGAHAGALKFRDVLRIGYKSVKSNTCPRVVVEDDE